jgi:predicted phage tail protein
MSTEESMNIYALPEYSTSKKACLFVVVRGVSFIHCLAFFNTVVVAVVALLFVVAVVALLSLICNSGCPCPCRF